MGVGLDAYLWCEPGRINRDVLTAVLERIVADGAPISSWGDRVGGGEDREFFDASTFVDAASTYDGTRNWTVSAWYGEPWKPDDDEVPAPGVERPLKFNLDCSVFQPDEWSRLQCLAFSTPRFHDDYAEILDRFIEWMKFSAQQVEVIFGYAGADNAEAPSEEQIAELKPPFITGVNLFGPRYAELFGRDRLLNVTAGTVTALPGGSILIEADDPGRIATQLGAPGPVYKGPHDVEVYFPRAQFTVDVLRSMVTTLEGLGCRFAHETDGRGMVWNDEAHCLELGDLESAFTRFGVTPEWGIRLWAAPFQADEAAERTVDLAVDRSDALQNLVRIRLTTLV